MKFRSTRFVLNIVRSMSTNSRNIYRPSACLIIAAKTDNIQDNYDYQILMFKRTVNTAFAPNHCVFPGGTFDVAADESTDWLKYFKAFGISDDQLLSLHSKQIDRPKPLLIDGINFSREISLRINAIRETFEEVGVLFCRNRQQLQEPARLNAYINENFDRQYWQHLVHNDAGQFLNLCKSLDVVPDLWSLYEWAVWRTQAEAKRKFETIYYLVGLEQAPNLVLEKTEVQSEVWGTPASLLNIFDEGKIWMSPYQYYDLSRLTHINSYKNLLEFAKKRAECGSTLYHPSFYRIEKVHYGTLPGDDLYPIDTTKHTPKTVYTCTTEEFRKRAQRLHRIIINDFHEMQVEMNIPELDGHLSPIRIRTNKKGASKL